MLLRAIVWSNYMDNQEKNLVWHAPSVTVHDREEMFGYLKKNGYIKRTTTDRSDS